MPAGLPECGYPTLPAGSARCLERHIGQILDVERGQLRLGGYSRSASRCLSSARHMK